MTRRILITGMSGVGKSSVVEELRQRGFHAVDIDQPPWSEYRTVESETEWLWNEDRVSGLLDADSADPLIVAGTSVNQANFYGLFDHVVLLTASEKLTVSRLTGRTNNDFGKDPAELAKVLADKVEYEPRLRSGADVVIDTSIPLRDVVDRIIELV